MSVPYFFSPQERHEVLARYLATKLQEHDWHAVSDAANDLRVLEAQWPEIKFA